MLYLDVTSACQSPLNTGIRRMQRGLHCRLAMEPEYHPVYWQSALRSYRRLGEWDQQNLTNPFARNVNGIELYDAGTLGVFSDWIRTPHDLRRRLLWPRDLQAGDVILVPDLIWGGRSVFFRRDFPQGVRRVGIFHDAIPMRESKADPLVAHNCGRAVRAFARFDMVVCISQEAEAELRYFWKQLGERAAPTCIVPWPVPFAETQPSGGPNFEAREILCVSRLEPRKNHLKLIEACEGLWREGLKFKLRLIGCKGGAVIPSWKIQRRIEALKAAGQDVEWRAHVSERALHIAYEACSFTVFPSLIEGFGLPIIESLWHGRPVVCDACGAMGEVAAGGGCETVDVRSAGSLAAGIRRLLTDKPKYESLRREAKLREYRSWEQYWSELRLCLAWNN